MLRNYKCGLQKDPGFEGPGVMTLSTPVQDPTSSGRWEKFGACWVGVWK
jgi:hypothetical protein